MKTTRMRLELRRFFVVMGLIVPVSIAFPAKGSEIKIALSGDQESPRVRTQGSGTGTLVVGTDRSIAGSISTNGISGTAAYIHEGPPGKKGVPILPLIKGSGERWVVPAGAKLTDGQEVSLLAGNLYVNVESEAHRSGEIRGQIRP